MSRSLNQVQLIGHLGQDAETRYTPNGAACSTFSIATSRRWKPEGSQEYKEETDWHRCILWRNENLSAYLKKGKQIYISGRLQTRKYDDNAGVTRYVTEVVCQEVILLGGGGSGERPPHPANANANSAGGDKNADGLGVTDDDVPF